MCLQVPFSVSGTAVAPSVHLSTACVSFGSLPANDTSVRAVYIHNKADLPVYFEFVTDQQGVFGFDRVRGSVGAMSSAHVTVTFQPKEASNYWRRVTCLVRVSKPLLANLDDDWMTVMHVFDAETAAEHKQEVVL